MTQRILTNYKHPGHCYMYTGFIMTMQ